MYGGEPKDYAIMSNKSDPFLMDTDTNYAAGRWLANMIAQYGITRIHDRGLHYVLVSAGVTRPDGKPYRNDAASWAWLLEKVSAARWLGHIQFNVIADQKNADGVFRIRTTPEPKGSVATDVDMKVPGAKDVQPTVGLAGFTGTQPYRIALVGEKSSLQPVLGPIAEKYEPTSCCSPATHPTPASGNWQGPRAMTVGRWWCCTSVTATTGAGRWSARSAGSSQPCRYGNSGTSTSVSTVRL